MSSSTRDPTKWNGRVVTRWSGRAFGAAAIGLCLVPASDARIREQAMPPFGATTAFLHATVIPMDRPDLLSDQTVIVQAGKIAAIGSSSSVKIPANATKIDAHGRFLIPGLADLHTHVDDPADFPLFLNAGVTTVMNMDGVSRSYVETYRPAVRSGRLLGPELLVAYKINGPGDPASRAFVPKTPAEAAAMVRDAKARGFDFVKVYTRLSPAVFTAVMDEARKSNIAVIGHVVRSVGLIASLNRGQRMLAHAEEYLTVFPESADANDAVIPDLVALTKAHGTIVTANLDGIERIAALRGHPEVLQAYLADPTAQSMRPGLRAKWRLSSYPSQKGSYVRQAQFASALVGALAKSGVSILAGTDTPDIPGVAPGVSLINELDALHRAGLSNFDALATATSNAGSFLRTYGSTHDCFGIIAVGCRADLILLGSNPLDDLGALRNNAGVMVRGRWLSRAALDRVKMQTATAYRAADQAHLAFAADVKAIGGRQALVRHHALLHKPPSIGLIEAELVGPGYDALGAKHFEDALALMTEATRLFPQSWNAHDSLADVLAAMGRKPEAAAEYRRASALNDNYPEGLEKARKLESEAATTAK